MGHTPIEDLVSAAQRMRYSVGLTPEHQARAHNIYAQCAGLMVEMEALDALWEKRQTELEIMRSRGEIA